MGNAAVALQSTFSFPTGPSVKTLAFSSIISWDSFQRLTAYDPADAYSHKNQSYVIHIKTSVKSVSRQTCMTIPTTGYSQRRRRYSLLRRRVSICINGRPKSASTLLRSLRKKKRSSFTIQDLEECFGKIRGIVRVTQSVRKARDYGSRRWKRPLRKRILLVETPRKENEDGMPG